MISLPNNNPLTLTKTLFILLLFISLITSIRVIWLHFNQTPPHPEANNGMIDLRKWNFSSKDTITLDGEWHYYPNKLIEPRVDKSTIVRAQTYKSIPEDENKLYFGLKAAPLYQYGTYRLKILLPESEKDEYALRLPSIQTASKIYVNGKVISQQGNPSESLEKYEAKSLPNLAVLEDKADEMDLLIQVASHSFKTGGIHEPIIFGKVEAVSKQMNRSKLAQIIVSVILLLHCMYSIIIYFMGEKKIELLYFGMVLFTTTFTILLDDDKLLLIMLPIEYDWSRKLIFLAYAGLTFFTVKFSTYLLSQHHNNPIFIWINRFILILSLFIVILPIKYLAYTGYTVIHLSLATFILIFIFMLRATLKGNRDIIILLLAVTSIISSFVGVTFERKGWPNLAFYPYDMIIAIIIFACFLFLRYIRISKQTEAFAEKLQKIDKMKDDFLAQTSHELRNPLHGVINIAQAIMDDKANSLSNKNKRSLDLLVNVGRHMTYTLNDLIDMTRIKEDQVKLYKKDLNIHSVSSAVINMIQFMTEGKDIKLVQNIPENFPKVLADENRLTQIIFNLLQNAVKFTDVGFVTISSKLKQKTAVITIEDTGIGIDGEWQNTVFSPYEQVDSSITSRSNGIGLGLSICKELVHLHGGTLSVQSVAGKGSIFTFTLPLADKPEDFEKVEFLPSKQEKVSPSHLVTNHEEIAAAMQNDNLKQKVVKNRILAVDDNLINLKILSDILSVEYHVEFASSGDEALQKLDSGNWDLVITDVMMPNMSGYELTAKIRQQYSLSELPVLLLTARYFREDIYAGFRSGANDFVGKPVDTVELKGRVNALINLKISIEQQLRLEAAWLQAQIQPHFLFNTINTIASLSDTDKDRMTSLLLEFGNYLHESFDLNNLNEKVPIENEINLIRSYLYIEKERFRDRLTIKWDIDKNLQVMIPPLSIQPLVENAVRHGVLGKIEGGTIYVRIKNQLCFTEVEIIDDGVGMEQTKVDCLLEKGTDKGRGIGLRNTNRRLMQLYGNGLKISSIPGVGTTVSFHIQNQ
jgi:two-component system, sensor histidine kinase ChiS